MKLIDLFSGIGGFSVGLEASGHETVLFAEKNERCRNVLSQRWPEVPILDDVRNLKQEHVRGNDYAISAGFPCQDISLAGDGAGLAGPRSSLFWEVMRAIRLVRPRVLYLENVAALLSRGMGTVLGALAEERYDAEWDCIRAVEAGRPHVRDRAFVAAYPEGDGRGPGRPGGLADGLAGLPEQPCWSGDPVAWFEERYSEPALLGVDDGVRPRLDRLNLCGNALIPAIPTAIAAAIRARSTQEKGND